MRYIYAILLTLCSLVPLILDGDGTALFFIFPVSMFLIWDKYDWTKGPYKEAEK